MAEIPVVRKSKGGFPKWLIPLLLILLLLGGGYYFFLRNNSAPVNNTNAQRPAGTISGAANTNTGTGRP